MFIVADSFVSPVYPSSLARPLRAPKLESISRAFIKSTIDVRHCNFSFLAATALSRMGAISIACVAAETGFAPPKLGAAAPLLALGKLASAFVPKIAPLILSNIPMRSLHACFQRAFLTWLSDRKSERVRALRQGR